MDTKKIITLVLGADFIGSLLYIFSLQSALKPLIYLFYIISSLLYLSGLLATIKNIKNNNKVIMIITSIITIALIVITTYSVIGTL